MFRVLSKNETWKAVEKTDDAKEAQLLWFCYHRQIPVARLTDWDNRKRIVGVLLSAPADADPDELRAPDAPARRDDA